jgi:DNA-binding winged helix-turn-helix (wHTH) protein
MKVGVREDLENLYTKTVSAKRELFYTGIYNYFETLESIPEVSKILLNEEEKLHHRESKGLFVSFPYYRIQSQIYWPIKWFKEENIEMPELDFLLQNRYPSNKDFKRKFVTDIEKWRETFTRLHLNLTTKLSSTRPVKSDSKFFELHNNGKFNYLGNSGSLNVASREYNLLKLLYENKNEIVKYSQIAQVVFKKETASKATKLVIIEVVRNIKRKLKILPKDKKYKDILKNVKNVGYSLEI